MVQVVKMCPKSHDGNTLEFLFIIFHPAFPAKTFEAVNKINIKYKWVTLNGYVVQLLLTKSKLR